MTCDEGIVDIEMYLSGNSLTAKKNIEYMRGLQVISEGTNLA